ncbi:hypothetical protein LT493_02410 [Streptomyces tricolor]|nr:hypothetical protein [Streptomyces tricolor]
MLPVGGDRAQRGRSGVPPASGDRAAAGRRGRGGPGAPGAARQRRRGHQPFPRRGETFANAPGTVAALRSPDPTAVLSRAREAAREATGVDFVVVMNTDGIRYTHPKPDRIGKKFVGTLAPALAGGTVTEHITGTIGPLVQVVVPVKDPGGKVVGLVSAGITTARVGGAADRQLPLLLAAAAAALALATAGTALVSRRLLRQTHGLGPYEMTRMYEHHDAVLHAVREGRADRRRRRPAAARQRRGAPAAGPARGRRAAARAGAGIGQRDGGAARLGAGRHGRGAPGQGPPAGDQPAAHRPARRPARQRHHPARLHRAAGAVGPRGGGPGAAEHAVRRRGGHRHQSGRDPDRAGAGRAGGAPVRGLRDGGPVRRGAERGGPRPGTALRHARPARASAKDAPLYPIGERIRFVATSPQARALTTGQSVVVERLRDEARLAGAGTWSAPTRCWPTASTR